LIELLVVIAIIVVLASVVMTAVAKGQCKAGVNAAQGALKECNTLFSSPFTLPSFADVSACLDKANEALKKLLESDWFSDDARNLLVPLADTVNRNVDTLIATGDLTEAQKQTLKDKKISIPAQGAGTSGN
jgi:type II secretory pathway pseudopilin PulG